MTTTPNLALTQYATTDKINWVNEYNKDMLNIDTAVKANQTSLDETNAIVAQKAYTLKATDNLQTILNSGIKNIELNPSVAYSFNNIALPSGTNIKGNGATITSPDTTRAIFYAGVVPSTGTTDITIDNIKFKGSTANADNLAMVTSDSGIRLHSSARVKITNCRFEHFLGAGINCDYFPDDVDYHMQHNIISNNVFHYCYFGIAIWNRAEYGICSDNIISYCRVGIWSQSGNWLFTGNSIFKCRAGFVSTLDLNNLVTTAGINPQHGSFVGNTVNHCRSDQTCGWSTANYLVNSIDYQGVWVDGAYTCYPPTFTGNTMYYSDLKYLNSASSGIPYWYITGCLFSNMTISSDLVSKMTLNGCTEQEAVTKTNVDAWTSPTFENSWSAYSSFTAGYRKTGNKVQLRGVIGGGTANTIAFTLPVGCRPTVQKMFFIGYTSGGALGTLNIDTNGSVQIVTFTTFISLDGVSFDI